MSGTNGPATLERRIGEAEAAIDFLRGGVAAVDGHLERLTTQVDDRHAETLAALETCRDEINAQIMASSEKLREELRKGLDRVLRVSSAGLNDQASKDLAQDSRIARLESAAQTTTTAAEQMTTAASDTQAAAETLSIHAPALTKAAEQAPALVEATNALQGSIEKLLPPKWKAWAPFVAILILLVLDRVLRSRGIL